MPIRDCFRNAYKRCLQCISLLLLVSVTINLSAREIEFIHIDLEDIRDKIKERVTERVEQRVRTEARARARQSIEDSVAESVFDTVTESVTASIETALPAALENNPVEVRLDSSPHAKLKSVDLTPTIDIDRVLESQLSRIEQEIDLALDTIEDREGNSALANEWLVMTDQATLNLLSAEGYIISHVEELNGLGYLLGTIRAPDSFNPRAIAAVQVLSNPQVVVDLNHVYLPQRDGETPARSAKKRSVEATNLPPTMDSAWSRIGMIDSSIDQSHSVFAGSSISESTFTPRGFSKTEQHGTAIASILVGQSDLYSGLSPESHLYNGVVFATDDEGREFSTTAAIVRAINWLAENNVRLINMSLAGPDNAILGRAISSACDKGITLVTAVGNAGPSSPPLYPAAYDCTIAVTAVDGEGKPYHRANRGPHVDFALPGVNVRHAVAGDAFGQSSGTSYAAAVLSGMISSMLPSSLMQASEVKERLNLLSTDVGQKGADTVFGQGIIHAPATARISH